MSKTSPKRKGTQSCMVWQCVNILSMSSLACPSSLECLSAESPISFSKYSILSAIVAWCKEPQESVGLVTATQLSKLQCAPAAKAKYETLGLGWISQLLMGLVYLAFDLVSDELTVFTTRRGNSDWKQMQTASFRPAATLEHGLPVSSKLNTHTHTHTH